MMAAFPVFVIGLATIVGGVIGFIAYLIYKGMEWH